MASSPPPAATAAAAVVVAGLWELFVRYNCRADVHRPFEAKRAAVAALLGDAGLVRRRSSSSGGGGRRRRDASSAGQVEMTAMHRMFDAASRAGVAGAATALLPPPQSRRLAFGQYVHLLRAVAWAGGASSEAAVTAFLQERLLDPLLYPSRHAELLRVLDTAYADPGVVDIYERVREPIADLLLHYSDTADNNRGCRRRPQHRGPAAAVMEYAAFREFSNDFGLQVRGVLTRADLGTVYAVATGGDAAAAAAAAAATTIGAAGVSAVDPAVGGDQGLDCPAVFDALILAAHWLYGARFAAVSPADQLKMLLVVMTKHSDAQSHSRQHKVAFAATAGDGAAGGGGGGGRFARAGSRRHFASAAAAMCARVRALWKADGRRNYLAGKARRPAKTTGQLLNALVALPDAADDGALGGASFAGHSSDHDGAGAPAAIAATEPPPPRATGQGDRVRQEVVQPRAGSPSLRPRRRASEVERRLRADEEEERQMILAQLAEQQAAMRAAAATASGGGKFSGGDDGDDSGRDDDGSGGSGGSSDSSVELDTTNEPRLHYHHHHRDRPRGSSGGARAHSEMQQRLDLRRLSALQFPHAAYERRPPPHQEQQQPVARRPSGNDHRVATGHAGGEGARRSSPYQLEAAAAAAAAAALADLESESESHDTANYDRWRAQESRRGRGGGGSGGHDGAQHSSGADGDASGQSLGLESSAWDWEAGKPNDDADGARSFPHAAGGVGGDFDPNSVAGMRLAGMTFDEAMAQLRQAEATDMAGGTAR